MHKLVVAVGLLRAPLVCMAVYIAALLPAQSREVFRAMREAEGWEFVIETVRAGAFALALALVVLTTCALLMKHVSELRKSASNIHFGLLEMLAIGLAGIPILSVWLLNVDFTKIEGEGSETIPIPIRYMNVEVNYIVYGATALVLAAAFGFLMRRASLRSAIISPFARLSLLNSLGLSAGACLVAGVIAAISVAAIQAPLLMALLLGPYGLLCLFFGILTISSCMMTAVYDRSGWPILSGLAIAALVFAYLGWNNNHEVRSLMAEAKSDHPPKSDGLAKPPVYKAFADWLENRPDRSHYTGRPYPVYVVAAEGGGLYAAVHAASALARLQNECPGFARHLFAISGVSGGSLGAAVFTSLVDALPPGVGKGCEGASPQGQSLVELVERYFKNDFLSPLLAHGLFPDFLQRFLPVMFPQFDRARGLEAAFEAAWKDTLAQVKGAGRENAFAAKFHSLWSASASKPALLLNATAVPYGSRIVIAPFTLRDTKGGLVDLDIDLLNQGEAVALSTAVGVSARFPVITPPAWRKAAEGDRLQMVDGGYYDNSGISTAVHLIDAIIERARSDEPSQPNPADVKDDTKDSAKKGSKDESCAPTNMVSIKTEKAGRLTVCFKLILIRSPPSDPDLTERGELTAPLFAAYNARFGHARAGTSRALGAYCGGSDCGKGMLAKNPHIYFHYLRAERVSLSWYFSKQTLDRLLRPPEAQCIQHGTTAATENACVVWRIREDLG